MNWLFTLVLCVGVVECVIWLPFGRIFTGVSNAALRALKTVRSPRISDHWKEKAVLAYAKRLFVNSVGLGGLMAIVVAAAGVLTLAFDQAGSGFAAYIVSWEGIVVSIVLACVYVTARKRVVRG